MPNQGQQRIPMYLDDGIPINAVFQVADVSRPLISVAKMCSLGNRVIFGGGGGVILNLKTGRQTPFVRKDGVYIFSLWVPPVGNASAAVNSQSPFVRQQ